jgi:(p)ppGpp synthase/HD superfamily hydrolase
MTPLETAISLALKYHEGQIDKAGLPYILHPLRVMEAVRHRGEVYMCVGVLHDILEDTDCTHEILDKELGATIADLVLILTKDKDESYDNYIKVVAMSRVATAVKFADMADNCSRLEHLSQEEEIRLRKKYIKARRLLTAFLESPPA